MKKLMIIVFFLSLPASAAEVCKQETKASFEKHLFAMKFREDGSCAIFYKDSKPHTACWSDGKTPVGVPTTMVRCK